MLFPDGHVKKEALVQDSLTIVLATRNAGKTAEMRALLENHPICLKNLDDFGPIAPVTEDGATFDENAYKKAAFTAKVLGYPALADDSGLVVEALNGAPGVHSARYAGDHATDEDRVAKLLLAMQGQTNRNASFECVLSLAVPAGPALTYEGRCEGVITEAPAGNSGFGYDPVFYYTPLKKTFAQLTREEKGRVSHRGLALNQFIDEFDKIIGWLRRHMPDPPKINCMREQP